MKNIKIFMILIGSTLVLIFLYIWHHNTVIRYVYQKQRLEKKIEDLAREKERLTNALLTAQNPHDIKKRAEALGMRQTPLSQMHRAEEY